MKQAYWKDIWRFILKSKKRFISIMVITMLGVSVLAAIFAACQNMYLSADRFYDEQEMFDIRVVSTLGLTKEDVDALAEVTGIEKAAGFYQETVHTEVGNVTKNAEVTVFEDSGINMPYVQKGALPSKTGEIAVTQDYLEASGKSIGDQVFIEEKLGKEEGKKEEKAESSEEDSESSDWDIALESGKEEAAPTFSRSDFIITGVVLSPLNINNSEMAFRTGASSDYAFFIAKEDASYDVYSSIYVTLSGLRELNCYSDEYRDSVDAVIDFIEAEIMHQREQARYDAVLGEALGKITEAEATMNKKLEEGEEQLGDAWAEIEKAKQELVDGEAKLTQEEKNALEQLADARATLNDGKNELIRAENELTSKETELEAGTQALAEGKRQLAESKQRVEAVFAELERVLEENPNMEAEDLLELFPEISGIDFEQVKEKIKEYLKYESVRTVLEAPEESSQLEGENVLDAVVERETEEDVTWPGAGEKWPEMNLRELLEQAKTAALQQFANAESEIAAGEAQLEAGRKQLQDGKRQIAAGWEEWKKGQEELEREEAAALRKLADAWRDLEAGKQELHDGELELTAEEQSFKTMRDKAKAKLGDAYAELETMDMAEWYVQDRTAIGSYSSLDSDMSSIKAIGNVFPVIFLVVAVLISLTTMTRMVKEERGLIGTYKALGFSDGSILLKYLFYALLACLVGGMLGNLVGFVLLPNVLIRIFEVMYVLPHVSYHFYPLYGIGGVLLFLLSIVLSTFFACRKELAQVPAALMRPKAPKAGSRTILEYIPFLWRRLSFLNKVTARNLFRYKKRLFMTILGITGCTALILLGFSIRDSVIDLKPKQYEQIYHYDLMVVTEVKEHEKWMSHTSEDEHIQDYLNLQIGSFKLVGEGGGTESVQLMVIPTGGSLEDYISLRDRDGAAVQLDQTGLFVTQNAAETLSLEPGSTVWLQNLQLDRREAVVSEVVQNYLGNNVYMTQELYETLYEDYEPNGILAHMTEGSIDHKAYTERLLEDDVVISAVSNKVLQEEFSENFTLINSVVYILILLAAGLAFVVLFTLSSTNISERTRELATIKVLGFYDNEVHTYLNKETMILTILGVLIGLPVGGFVSGLLTYVLKMPALYFAVSIHPLSYLIAAVLSLSFAIIVNCITKRSLNRIDMVEALKGVE